MTISPNTLLQEPDPRKMQINLTGFLNGKYARYKRGLGHHDSSNCRVFMGELWTMLDSAQNSPNGIPEALVNMKMEEMKSRSGEDKRMAERLRKLADAMGAEVERKGSRSRSRCGTRIY